MHSRRFYLKFAAIAILMVFLLIPQSVILDLVSERASWREQAYQSIGQSWPGEQTLAGPVLVIPYTLTYNRKETAKDAKAWCVKPCTRKNLATHSICYPSNC